MFCIWIDTEDLDITKHTLKIILILLMPFEQDFINTWHFINAFCIDKGVKCQQIVA